MGPPDGRAGAGEQQHRQRNLSREQEVMGHRDPSITLRVYSHWLPEASKEKLVDRLDDTAPDVTQASPATSTREIQNALSALNGVVSLNFASWNQLAGWLREIEGLRAAA